MLSLNLPGVIDAEVLADASFEPMEEIAVHLFGASAAFVFIVQQDGRTYPSGTEFAEDEGEWVQSFARRAADAEEPIVIEDATHHADEPPPGVEGDAVRFYAGTPLLTSEGRSIGALVVLDSEPQSPAPTLLRQLENVGSMVVSEVERSCEASTRRDAEAEAQELRERQKSAPCSNGAESVDDAAALREERDRFATLFHNLPTPVLHGVRDEEAILVSNVNKAFESVFGHDPDTIRGEAIRDVIVPEDREAEAAEIRKRLREGEMVHREVRRQTPDGMRDFRLQVAVREDETGPVEGFAIYTDITERKEQERRRRENERRFRAVFEDPHMLVGLLDLEGTLLEANETSMHYVDVDREAVLGEFFWETPWWTEDLRADVKQWVKRASEGEYVDYNVSTVQPDGSPYSVRGSVRPVTDESGEVVSLIVSARDVTERARMEDELREREARLRGLANSIPGVVFQFSADAKGNYKHHFISDHAEQLLGISSESDTFFERFAERVPEAYRAEVRNSVDEAVENVDAWSFEMPFEKPSGERIWLRGLSTPEAREDGIVFNGVLLDVTERKEMEQELRDRERWFRSLTQNLSDGIFRCTPEDGIVYANDAFARMFGYDDAAALQGADPATLYADPAQHEHFRTIVHEEGSVDGAEVEFERRDGSTFIGLLNCTSFRCEEAGEVAYYDGAITDITERREAEVELRKTKNFYEQVLEQVPIDLAVFSPDARFEYLNTQSVSDPEMREWLIGRTNEDYCRKRGHDLEMGRLRDEKVREVARTKQRTELEETMSTGDGPRHFWRVHGPVMNLDGEVTHVAAFGLDITEQRRYEQELIEAKEEAEEAARLKTAMLANMSHEVRTPLTSIIGFSEMLTEELEGGLGEFAEKIYHSSQRLMSTLDSVLQLSKLEAGMTDLERATEDLSDAVRETVEMLRARAEDQGVTLEATLPADPVTGQWNEGALNRIAGNLVENAIKFTPEGGHVEVRLLNRGDDALLEVEDTGVGISEEFQPHVFEAFKQESDGLRREYEGSGLGLSIVQQLVEAHGGDIELESEEGTGTRFRIRLPRHSSPSSGSASGS